MKRLVASLMGLALLLGTSACAGVGFGDKMPGPNPDHGAENIGPPPPPPYFRFRIAILPEITTIEEPYASRNAGGYCTGVDQKGQPVTMKDLKTGVEAPFLWKSEPGKTSPYEAWGGWISYPAGVFPELDCHFEADLMVGDSMELEITDATGTRVFPSPYDVLWVDPRPEDDGDPREFAPYQVHQLIKGV